MAYSPKAFTPGASTTLGLSPAVHGVAVTPSDTVPLPFVSNQIWVGGAGALAVQLAGDAAPVIIPAVPVGTMLHLCATFVMATGTVATNIVVFG